MGRIKEIHPKGHFPVEAMWK